MRKAIAVGAAVVVIGGAAAGCSSKSTTTPSASPTTQLTLAEACPKVDSVMNALTEAPTSAELQGLADQVAAVANQSNAEAAQAINALTVSLQKAATAEGNLENQQAQADFLAATKGFLTACAAAGAPLTTPSPSVS